VIHQKLTNEISASASTMARQRLSKSIDGRRNHVVTAASDLFVQGGRYETNGIVKWINKDGLVPGSHPPKGTLVANEVFCSRQICYLPENGTG